MDKRYVIAKWVDYSVWPHKIIEKMELDFDNIDEIYSVEGPHKVRIVMMGYSSTIECDEVLFWHGKRG